MNLTLLSGLSMMRGGPLASHRISIKAHILPVEFRIIYKLCYYAHKVIQGLATPYINEMFFARQLNRSLRSSLDMTLLSTNYASTTVAHQICTKWNDLPRQIREISNIETFKIRLKTHLFNLAFTL